MASVADPSNRADPVPLAIPVVKLLPVEAAVTRLADRVMALLTGSLTVAVMSAPTVLAARAAATPTPLVRELGVRPSTVVDPVSLAAVASSLICVLAMVSAPVALRLNGSTPVPKSLPSASTPSSLAEDVLVPAVKLYDKPSARVMAPSNTLPVAAEVIRLLFTERLELLNAAAPVPLATVAVTLLFVFSALSTPLTALPSKDWLLAITAVPPKLALSAAMAMLVVRVLAVNAAPTLLLFTTALPLTEVAAATSSVRSNVTLLFSALAKESAPALTWVLAAASVPPARVVAVVLPNIAVAGPAAVLV